MEDNGPKGLMGNELSSNEPAAFRMVRYGKWKSKIAETISYGGNYFATLLPNIDRFPFLQAVTPKDVVSGFIVDDGNDDRSQRNTLLNGGT